MDTGITHIMIFLKRMAIVSESGDNFLLNVAKIVCQAMLKFDTKFKAVSDIHTTFKVASNIQ